ncbi:MAG: tripartite tricarboxylate transporter permease, partial [Nanoarchaeota archaeon]
LPLLSGLFGGSGLVLSIIQKTKIPKQKTVKKIKFEKKEILKATIGAAISAPLCSFLPAIGSGHAAAIGSEITQQNRRGFLIMLGAINTIVMTLSFATLYAISKTRTGAAAAVQEIVPSLSIKYLIIITSISIITILAVSFITIRLSKFFAQKINKIKYHLISIAMLSVLLIVLIIFTNVTGIIVFLTGAALGIFTTQSNIRKINLMGCLMLPTILFYLL